MDKKQAQWILSLARPNGQDASDPQIAEALALAASDPDLSRWWQSRQTADQQVGTALRKVSVPPHLRQSILAGARLQPQRRTLWQSVQSYAPLALAASLVVAALVATHRPVDVSASSGLATNDSFQKKALGVFNLGFYFDHENKDPAKVEGWLASHGVDSLGNVPKVLRDKPTLGCRIFTWHQKKMVLVCYDLPNNHEAHLFVLDGRLPDAPDQNPRFEIKEGLSTASWSDETKTYFLTSDAPMQQLQSYF